MGRSFESDELDRPDLNKCPDCGAFFAGDNCPLCGKECPVEYRAGNRKPVKKKKRASGSSRRITFVEWYHSWWFIILMLFVAPIIGIILLATSPHKKQLKLALIAVAVVYTIVSYFGIGNIISRITNEFSEPVDTSLSREEYIAACETVSAEELYRKGDGYSEKFVSVTLVVTGKITDSEGYYGGGEYNTYYVCKDPGGSEFDILVRDCIQDSAQKFIDGDVITLYGEGAGDITIYDLDYVTHEAPCIYAAYVVLND